MITIKLGFELFTSKNLKCKFSYVNGRSLQLTFRFGSPLLAVKRAMIAEFLGDKVWQVASNAKETAPHKSFMATVVF
jgi:hypothetical protein